MAQWLSFACAQDDEFCQFSREFRVDNCTACPTVDTTRDNITMATCKEPGPNGSSLCVCADFPANFSRNPILVYYAQKTENATACTNTWAEAPYLKVVFVLLDFCLYLYATAHLVYIIRLSKLCSCQRNKCTKINIAMLCFFMNTVQTEIRFVLEIIPITIGTGYGYYSYVVTYYISNALGIILFDLCQILMVMGVFDTAFSGDKMVRGRCFVSTFLWTIMFAKTVLDFVQLWTVVFQSNYGVMTFQQHEVAQLGFFILLILAFSVMVIVAHRKICQVRDNMCSSIMNIVHITTAITTPSPYAAPLDRVPVCDISSQTRASRETRGVFCCLVLLLLPCCFYEHFRGEYRT